MSEDLVGACGLLCSECEAFLATQANDSAQIDAIAAKWTEMYETTIPAEYVWCDGCMTEGDRKCGHTAECQIRACAVERGLTTCADCMRYECDKLTAFLDNTVSFGTRDRLEGLRPVF